MYKHTLLIGNGFGSRRRLLSIDFGPPSEVHSTISFIQASTFPCSLKCQLTVYSSPSSVLLFITLAHYFDIVNLFLVFEAVDRSRNTSSSFYKSLT